ncbi:hypothetical protein [Parahalioglobus pacificus]|uniref:Uncharacterized protein n=1 Tax=Parahalioglobus pacificus TaxID=930806 RepID=A0A918XE02_9GAMM|nr:hypothetical protein [Halioglobus pacificus]GHD27392.1 hypothetical protein GCM10007053_05600 [Halioglobus pacificus]
MAQTQRTSMSQEQFLTIAVNLINRTLLEAQRTEAKQLFKQLSRGNVLPITQVRLEDESLVRFDLALDHSEFVGKLNFGAFRGSVAVLLANLANAVQEGQTITVFSAEQDTESKMFGITAATEEDGQANVMVLGSEAGGDQARVLLRLMYLDPKQFTEQAQA